jgi:putative endonuclease
MTRKDADRPDPATPRTTLEPVAPGGRTPPSARVRQPGATAAAEAMPRDGTAPADTPAASTPITASAAPRFTKAHVAPASTAPDALAGSATAPPRAPVSGRATVTPARSPGPTRTRAPSRASASGRRSAPARSPAAGRNAAVGRYGERVAERHLTEAGLVVLDRNWRCAIGELDLVARDGLVVVACEVKTRRKPDVEHPLAAVTPGKADRLRRLAEQWIADHPEHVTPGCDVRVDLVAVLPSRRGAARVEHVRGAC